MNSACLPFNISHLEGGMSKSPKLSITFHSINIQTQWGPSKANLRDLPRLSCAVWFKTNEKSKSHPLFTHQFPMQLASLFLQCQIVSEDNFQLLILSSSGWSRWGFYIRSHHLLHFSVSFPSLKMAAASVCQNFSICLRFQDFSSASLSFCPQDDVSLIKPKLCS